jgi:tetratricopeptide (TPR) repeat protein
MSRKLIAIIALLILAGGAAAVLLLKKPAETALQMPDLSPRAGESTPSAEFTKAQATLTKFRLDLKTHPDAIKDYIEIAQVYLQEARVTGKHHQYLPIAGNVLDEALKHDPKNFDATILKASMEMTLHQFIKARDLAVSAIVQNPYSSFAYGVLCDAHVELGEYTKAAQDVDSMMQLRPDLRSYARASYLRELNGDRPGAIDAMKYAADAGMFGQENREWALFNLGNIFLGEGDLANAEHIFKGILEERPSYAFAMSGLAQVSAARGDYPTATEMLVKASQLSPEHIFIEQLADMYHAKSDGCVQAS